MHPKTIVDLMMQKDVYSHSLGIEIIEIQLGYAKIELKITSKMVNGFNIAHGGISYSLADSALAFAANTYGFHCMSIETSISHTRPTKVGDTLTATCRELNRGKKLGIYEVTIQNQHNKTIALFKGTVFISDDIWE